MKHLPLLFLVIASQGCMSLNSLQSARVVKKGKVLSQLGYSDVTTTNSSYDKVIRNEEESTTVGDSDREFLENTFPQFEAGFRYGLGNGYDLGVKSGSVGYTTLDVKKNLINDKHFASALGAGFGFTALSVVTPVQGSGGTGTDPDSGKDEYKTRHVHMTDLFVSWINTFDYHGWLGLHVAPRFIYRRVSYTTQAWEEPFVKNEEDVDVDIDEDASERFQYRGLAVGASLGKYLTLFGELAIYDVTPVDPVRTYKAVSLGLLFSTHVYDTPGD